MLRQVDKKRQTPLSCDTFVAVGFPINLNNEGNATASSLHSVTVFGKNSDRPKDEEHEVVYYPTRSFEEGSNLKCQYLTIPQAKTTHAVVLSRPSWLWGCEMGANEWGLCAGNEAVWSRENDKCDDGVQRLIGMDFVRLVLERAKTAREAVTVCSNLLEEFGQGGGCAEDDSTWCYENGFLFADRSEAWILETAGKSWWAAEMVKMGTVRNISNGLSIRTPDLMHQTLEKYCRNKGWLKESPGTQFDWKSIMSESSGKEKDLTPTGREKRGSDLLKEYFLDGYRSQEGNNTTNNTNYSNGLVFNRMARILRDEEICMTGEFQTTGSQISILSSCSQGSSESSNDMHFFTNYNPNISIYKPFVFVTMEDKSDINERVENTNLSTKTNLLWQMHHTMNRRERKTIKDELTGKENEFLCKVEMVIQNKDMKKQVEISFEDFVDEEINVLKNATA